MKRALVVANGVAPSNNLLKQAVKEADLVVAVDGGMDILQSAKLKADIWVGDMDSTKLKLEDYPHIEIVKLLEKKDITDLDYAIQYIMQKDVDNIEIVAGFGGKIDHLLTNINLLRKYNDKVKISFFDDSQLLLLVTGKRVIKGINTKAFSLVPLTKLENLSIIGAEYELDSATVEMGSSLCQSNLATAKQLELNLKGEALLVVSV